MGLFPSQSVREVVGCKFLDVQVANALIGVGTSVAVPIVTMVGRQIGYKQETIASYASLISACHVLADIPTGILADYVDLRRLMSVAVFVQSAGCALVFFLSCNEGSLAAFCVINGTSTGVFFLARHIYVSGLLKPKHRGMVMAFLSGILRFAHMLGPVLLGVIASLWGDVRYFFFVPMMSSLLAWLSLQVASCCLHVDGDAAQGKNDEDVHCNTEHWRQDTHDDRKRLISHVVNEGPLPDDQTPCIDHAVCVKSYGASNSTDIGRHDSGETDQVVEGAGTCLGYCLTPPVGDAERPTAANYCAVIVNQWSVIWRLGVYIILLVALRANRKLLLTFAAMRQGFTDVQLSLLLSVSFSFDACLFPLGGLLVDHVSRRFSRLPVVLGLGGAFLLLPLQHSDRWLYLMAAAFGVADALGCGLIMTLVADFGQQRFGGMFFGIMRTVQDMGHVIGAATVSLVIHHFDFTTCCNFWGMIGVVAALWGWYAVPVVDLR
uniref:Uncharacterized protein TCIL3000_11_12900 n=1 Tax=Trypanosoma congolense (strain IL3000) TaxID=1068625 RepID=G0V2C0_TRYCI|nr:unnamed protein product [Trypanosoma congolense IL3000]